MDYERSHFSVYQCVPTDGSTTNVITIHALNYKPGLSKSQKSGIISAVVIFAFLLLAAVGYALYRRRKRGRIAEEPISTLEVNDMKNENIAEAGGHAREEMEVPHTVFEADNKYAIELDAGFVGHEIDGAARDKDISGTEIERNS